MSAASQSKMPNVMGHSNKRVQPFLRSFFWIFLSLLAMLLCVLHWGGDLLVADESPPAHTDGIVVLQGSIAGEKARLAGAASLLQQGIGDRMLLSIPKESYWGQSISPIAYSYVEKEYGHQTASRTEFCETGPDVDSTQLEAQVLIRCMQERGWNSVLVVTSDYHSRRAGIIWRRTLRQQSSTIQLAVHGVADPEFSAAGWWRKRRFAKTWLGESTKLVWTLAVR
jgi:hypothetical protein